MCKSVDRRRKNKYMKRILLSLFLLSTIFISCVDEKYYKESNECNILVFDIMGQIDNRIIEGGQSDTGIVEVKIPISMDISNLTVSSAKYSSLAKSNIDALKLKDFSKDVFIKLIAEDEEVTKIWKIMVSYGDAPLQLVYSDMKKWTIAKDENGNEIKINTTFAYFPGEANVFSPWQHSAKANTLSGFFSVNPKPDALTSDYASIETKLYPAGAMMHSAVVAGALFTGKFLLNFSHLPNGNDPNPRKLINFGTAFYNKPQAVRFKLRYKPGLVMKDGDAKDILQNDPSGRPSKDSCEIYFMLQNRNQDNNKFLRVGVAWLRTGDSIGNFESESGFMEITLPFIYGQPSAQMLEEKPYMKIGGMRGELVFYRFVPNGTGFDKIQMIEEYAPPSANVDNIIVVLSSSAYGDMFWGAPGSRLDIKDIEFIY